MGKSNTGRWLDQMGARTKLETNPASPHYGHTLTEHSFQWSHGPEGRMVTLVVDGQMELRLDTKTDRVELKGEMLSGPRLSLDVALSALREARQTLGQRPTHDAVAAFTGEG